MELIFLWIENYKNIFVDQGFNLSSQYLVTYDKDKKEITIQDNPNHVHLFHKDIVDIKAIVGENGSGKSSLFKYLLSAASNIFDASESQKVSDDFFNIQTRIR